jgi:hypothetical protein
MSSVAKKSKMGALVDTPYKQPDTCSLSFGPGSKKMPSGCKLGEEVVLVIRGNVKSLSADDYGQSLSIEVKSVEEAEDNDD